MSDQSAIPAPQPINPETINGNLVTFRPKDSVALASAASVTYEQKLTQDSIVNSAVNKMEKRIKGMIAAHNKALAVINTDLTKAHTALVDSLSSFAKKRLAEVNSITLGSLTDVYEAKIKVTESHDSVDRKKGTVTVVISAAISVPENREEENNWGHQNTTFTFPRTYSWKTPPSSDDSDRQLGTGLATIKEAENALTVLEDARDAKQNEIASCRVKLQDVPSMIRDANARLTDKAIASMDGGEELMTQVNELVDDDNFMDTLGI